MKNDGITAFVKKNYVLIIIGICLVVILLFLSETFGDGKTDDTKKANDLESELELFLSGLKGVGECDVLLFYEKQQQSTFSSTLEEKLSGVAVLCEGGGDSGIKSMIIDILTRLLGLSGSRITINERK